MITIKLKKHLLSKSHTVVLYDSIDNLPIHLFSKMQKYQLIENGIGSNISEFDKHFEDTIDYLNHDKKDKAIKELRNLRHLFFHSLNEINPSHLSFCCMVYSIDGKQIVDYSEESLKRLCKQLSTIGLTQRLLAEQAVKKKSMTN